MKQHFRDAESGDKRVVYFKAFAIQVVQILVDTCLFVSSQGLIQSLTHSA